MTAATFDGVALPCPDLDSPVAHTREARNYLSTQEHRKLFWAFMPPAVVVVIVLEVWLSPLWERPTAPPEAQVDTRLEVVMGPLPTNGAVVILSDDELPDDADAVALGASPEALARVRDATFFSSRDREAWVETFGTLEGSAIRPALNPKEVSFTEVFSQPRAFRGQPVRMRGTLRRLEKIPAWKNDSGIDQYWQGWLEPTGGPASPVVVHFRRLPEGMPEGLRIAEPVVVSGFFLKNMAYQAADGVRLAPLVLSSEPVRSRQASAPQSPAGSWGRSIGALGVVTMLALVSATWVAYQFFGRGRLRRAEASGFNAALADIELFSVSESLQKLAADAADGKEVTGGVNDK